MKKIINGLTILLLVTCFVTSCQKNDDDLPPDGSIHGNIIDSITGQPIQTEQPGGIRIRVYDAVGKYENRTPFYLSVKPDGTYKNTKIFTGDYEMMPVEGAFFPLVTAEHTQMVTIRSTTEINFAVMPYLAVTATATPGAGSVSVTYKLLRSRVADKISEARLLVASVPAVSANVFDNIDGVNKVAVRSFSAVPDQTVLDGEYTDIVTGLLPGKKYYVRVAARTVTNAKYNYSPVFEITIL